MTAAAATVAPERPRVAAAVTIVALVGALAAVVVLDARPAVAAPLVLLAVVLVAGYPAIARWRSLVALVVAVVFFIPIKRYTLPSALPFNLEPYRLVIAAVVVGWVTSLLIDRRVRVSRAGLEGPAIVFALAAVASVAVNNGRISALGLTAQSVKSLTFFASFFLFLYVVVSVVRKRRDLEMLVRFTVACGALVAVSAIVESRTNYNVFNDVKRVLPFLDAKPLSVFGLSAGTLDRSGRLRVYASAEHPIELAAVLVMLTPLALYLWQTTRRRRWFVAATVLVLGALATVSRTGVVMLVVVALVLLWLRPAHMKRLLPLLVPALCVVYFALPHTLGSFYAAFFPKTGLIADQSATTEGNHLVGDGRLADIGPSLREWAQRPLLGEGFGSRVSSRLDSSVTGVPRARLLDDQWLGSLLETGIVGVGALLWLFTRAIRRMTRAARDDEGADGLLATAIAAALWAFAIGMLTFDALGFVQVTILFFILLAFSSVLVNLRKGEPG